VNPQINGTSYHYLNTFLELNLTFSSFDYLQAKRMDVVAGETAGVEGQLLLLYPVLFILQVYRV
jgi:hypothetical protein